MKKIYEFIIGATALVVFPSMGIFGESSESSKNYNTEELKENRLNLVEEAGAGTFETRMKAITECGLGRMHYCLRVLIENLDDPNPAIRNESIRGLGFLGMEEAVEPLLKQIEKLDKELEENKKKEEEYLEKLKNEKDMTQRSYYVTIIQGLHDDYKMMLNAKAAALWAIGSIEAESAVDKIKAYIKDKEDSIRRITATAIGEIGAKSGLPILEEAIEAEKVDRVKVDMLKAYLLIDSTKTKYIDQVILLLRDDEPWVRYYAANAVYDLNLFNAHVPLKRALKIESDPMVRKALYRAFEKSAGH